ncbi:MAG: type II secretion system F family protein, partial [Eubacteriales bacterium]
VFNALIEQICEGMAFSDAMEKQGSAFPELLINMVRSAETSGTLDITLAKMGGYYERQNRLNKKISSSLIYPKMLTVILAIAVVFIVAVIVPQFEPVFAMMDKLPAPTQFLLDLSDLIKSYWYVIAAVIALVVIAGKMIVRIPAVRMSIDKTKLHTPLFGKLLRVIYTSRFANTLSSLYSGGIPITTALAVGRHTIGNLYIDSQFDAVIEHLRAGESLSAAISEVDGLEKKLSSVIMVGEESGNLDEMLINVSERMNYESEAAIDKLVTLIEPVLIILMAAIVGFIMVSVMLPIIQLYSTIEQSSYM